MLRSSRIAALLLGLALGGCNCGHHETLGSADALPSAPNLNFGPIPINQTSVLPLPVSNTGTITMQPGTMTITGPNAGDFRVVGTFPSPGTVTSGDTVSLHVAFQPSQAGVRNAVLAIPSNSQHTPILNVQLTGQGGDVAVVATPQPLNFGNVLVGRDVTLPLTLTNQGATASPVIAIQPLGGPQASWFSQTSTPAAIPPGGTLVIQVTFSPQAVGPATADLPVVLCTTCTATQLTLVGQGVQGQLTFVPYPISFPTVPANTTANQSVTASNTGSYPIVVGSLELQSGASPAITLTGGPSSFPITLAPAGAQPDAGAQSFSFTVNYAPTSTNGDTATVEADWASQGGVPQPGTDPVYGNTSLNPCQLTFSPPGVNFGNASAGTTLKKYLTVGNTGQEACSVTNIALDTTSDPSFVLPSNPGTLTIPASGSAQIEIDFNLQNPGNPLSRKGYLDFDSTDPNHATGQVPLTAFLQGSSPYSAGWPKYHFDNTDRGQSEADTSGLQGVVLWKYPVAPPSQATGLTISGTPTYMNSPVVGADGTVYQTTLDGQFIAVDPSGTLDWAVAIDSPAQDPHPSTPIIAADGTLFLESGTDSTGGHLYHFAADGTQLASDAPPNLCNPSGEGSGSGGDNGCPDGFDVCPSIGNDGLLYDGDDFGATLTYSVGSNGSLNEGSGIVLNYTGERVAVALDTSDNSYWCSSSSCWAVSSVDAGFNVLWGGQNGTTIDSAGASALGFTNSDLAWDRDHTGMLMVMEATLANSFLGGFGGGSSSAQTWLVAMDPATGNVPWKYAMPSFTTPTSPGITGGIFSADFGNAAPAVADDGTVYVGNGDGLYAFSFTGTGSSTMGTLKPGFPFQAADVDSAPAIGGDGTVFFGCADGTFYAVNPDGSLRFKIVTGGRISSAPAIGPDGTVFFVSDEGNLYAVH